MAGSPLPDFLHSIYDRWCTWALKKNPNTGRLTKVPDCSTLRAGEWRDLEDVQDTARTERGGIGLVFTHGIEFEAAEGERRLLALDVDACIVDGEVASWAQAWVDALDSYTEVSPSGTGLRILFATDPKEADDPPMVSRVMIEDGQPVDGKKPQVQVFGLGPAGYVAITGNRLKDCPARLRYTPLRRFLTSGPGEALRDNTPRMKHAAPAQPVDEDTITERVLDNSKGHQLITGEWQEVTPNATASEAYHLLASLAFRASNGDVSATVDWLLSCTAWGKGHIDGSADPDRYARHSWVEAEVLRIEKKGALGVDAAAVFEPLDDDDDDDTPPAAEKDTERAPLTLSQCVERWQHEGPLVHMPTGLATLDELTGGGPVLGSRVYLIGAPDAGKTALLVQIMDTYVARGIPCALLAVDEEPGDVAMRLLQRRGYSRADCEQRTPAQLAAMLAAAADATGLWIYDASWTVEEAMVDFAKRSGGTSPAGLRAVFLDSVQTVRSKVEDVDASTYSRVTERVAAIRAGAVRYRMLSVATSEMSRNSYRSRKAEETQSDMAAAKESGAIEYSARVLLSLRPVTGESDTVELRVVKNKHGRSHRNDENGIFLRMDRPTQTLTEDTAFTPIDEESEVALAKAREGTEDAWRLFAVLFESPASRNEALTRLAWSSKRRLDNAQAVLLGWGVIEVRSGEGRRQVMHVVDGDQSKVPADALKVRSEVLGW